MKTKRNTFTFIELLIVIAFTFVELLIVIVIAVLISAIFVHPTLRTKNAKQTFASIAEIGQEAAEGKHGGENLQYEYNHNIFTPAKVEAKQNEFMDNQADLVFVNILSWGIPKPSTKELEALKHGIEKGRYSKKQIERRLEKNKKAREERINIILEALDPNQT